MSRWDAGDRLLVSGLARTGDAHDRPHTVPPLGVATSTVSASRRGDRRCRRPRLAVAGDCVSGQRSADPTGTSTTPPSRSPGSTRPCGASAIDARFHTASGCPSVRLCGRRPVRGRRDGLPSPPIARRTARLRRLPRPRGVGLLDLRARRQLRAGRDPAPNAARSMGHLHQSSHELERAIADELRVPRHRARRSMAHGDQVATAIYEWSTGDGGHDGYLRNFPPDYVPPAFPGAWRPTPLRSSARCSRRGDRPHDGAWHASLATAPLPPPTFSEDPGSAFFTEAIEVYETVNSATGEQLAIARFWSDDPGQTATPAGHSISILSQVLAAIGADLGVAADSYARLGIALSTPSSAAGTRNTATTCSVRSATSESTSTRLGRSAAADDAAVPRIHVRSLRAVGAMAHVLADLFGPMSFIDHTHTGRGLAPRSFASFDAAAEEAAISRLYGGIHYRSAIEHGLRQGSASATLSTPYGHAPAATDDGLDAQTTHLTAPPARSRRFHGSRTYRRGDSLAPQPLEKEQPCPSPPPISRRSSSAAATPSCPPTVTGRCIRSPSSVSRTSAIGSSCQCHRDAQGCRPASLVEPDDRRCAR